MANIRKWLTTPWKTVDGTRTPDFGNMDVSSFVVTQDSGVSALVLCVMDEVELAKRPVRITDHGTEEGRRRGRRSLKGISTIGLIAEAKRLDALAGPHRRRELDRRRLFVSWCRSSHSPKSLGSNLTAIWRHCTPFFDFKSLPQNEFDGASGVRGGLRQRRDRPRSCRVGCV